MTHPGSDEGAIDGVGARKLKGRIRAIWERSSNVDGIRFARPDHLVEYFDRKSLLSLLIGKRAHLHLRPISNL
jgi:hypothetical protein